MEKVWKIKSKKVDKNSKDWLAKVLAANRGLDTPKKLQDFLGPSIDQILDVKLTDLEKAMKRVEEALKNKEKTVVYSDYDADGLCATAIMWETLYDLGANILPYVPHRMTEGYGLSKNGIKKLAEDGATLIITVDNGVTAVEQVEFAKSLGVDIIITDHHVLPTKPPNPKAMVHSTSLCGAGVAWLFCYHLISKIKPDYKDKLLEKLELAALATIADLVPLIGGSRSIVKLGLEKMSTTKRPGIKALIRSANITKSIGTYEIGHMIAPRINAMGRIGHGLDSLRLLCAKNQAQADELAGLLSKTNSKRQDLTVKAVDHAKSLVNENHLVGVISHESWHEGVIGLVASRLVEIHYKPMIVISRGEKFSKGSARSIAGFNIVEAIRGSSEFLVDAGGHPMAAGFTIETRHIEAFTKSINLHAEKLMTDEILTPTIQIECELEKSDISQKTFQIASSFEPYGMGNPQPIFLTKGMYVDEARTVGGGNEHLKLNVDGIDAIGFNFGELKSEIRPGYQVDLVYNIAEDNYGNANKIQLKIKDLRIPN